MEALLYSIIELNIIFALCGFGLFLIRKQLNSKVKRVLILVLPAISLSIMWLKEVLKVNQYGLPEFIELDPVTIGPGSQEIPLDSSFSMSFFLLLAIPPLAAFLYRLIKPIINIAKRDHHQKGNFKVSVYGNSSYSFFNWITVEEGLSKEESDIVVHHESIHAKLFHSIDNILYEAYSIALWLNPIYHLLRKEMKLNHEYQVDAILFERYENKYVNLLLNHTFGTSSISYLLTNQFMDASQLKKRIFEMKTKRKQKLAWLLVVPLLGISATTVSFTNKVNEKESSQINQDDGSFIKASFKGGMDKYIAYFVDEIKYPEAAKSKNIEGKVLIEFIVKADGSISNANVKNSSNSIFDKEALRVVNKMPSWNPATKDGKPVKSKMVVPIMFKL